MTDDDEEKPRLTEAILGTMRTLKYIAKNRVKVADQELARISADYRRLENQLQDEYDLRGIRPKNDRLLAQFEDSANQAKLLYLPAMLYSEARERRQKDRIAACTVRDSIAIELLIYTNLRKGELFPLRIDRHMTWHRDLEGDRVVITIPKSSTKNRRPSRHELVGDTVQRLRIYLRDYHKILAPGSPYLFPGRFGGHASEGYSHHLSDLIRRKTGLIMHVHLFRHLGAKLYNQECPGDMETIRRQLNHGSIETTSASYVRYEEQASQRHYQQVIRNRRAALARHLPALRRRRRRRKPRGGR